MTNDKLQDQKLLVIGGAGFIGSHIVDQLLQQPVREVVVFDNFVRGSRANLSNSLNDARLTLVEGDIRDRDMLRRSMDGVDGLFHLAALWLYECVHEPRAAMDVNVMGTFNVIQSAQEARVSRIVYSSSASVYGDAVFTPMTEEHPLMNRTTYGATKIAGEQILRAYNEQHDLDYVGLRYMNVYGPRMDYKGTYVSVIMKVLDRFDANEPPIIFGDGSQAYDFVHVEDVARANLLAMASEVTDEFFNVGTGHKTSVLELVSMLSEISGSAVEPEFKPQAEMFVTHRVGSTTNAREKLGFEAVVPLRAGLESVVEWRRRDRRGRD